MTSEEIPIFGRWDEHASPQLQAVFEEVWNRVFADFGIGELARSLAEIDHGLRFNELLWHLNFMHSKILVVIKDVYVDHGYFPEADRTDSPSKLSAQWLIDSGFFNILPEFRKEDFYSNLSSDRRQRFFETLFSIPTYITRDQLLARKYDRYRKVADTPIEKNRRILVLDFPEVYLNCVERLLWPQWYTACFTRNYQNSSMWGNYANNHKGACLIFETKDSEDGAYLPLNRVVGYRGALGQNREELRSLTPTIFRPVAYSEKPKEVEFFRSIGRLPVPTLMKLWYTGENGDISVCASHVNAELDRGSWQESYWEEFHRDIAVKDNDWQYEEEERLILYSLLDPELDSRQRALTYEFNSLSGIVFGIRTPDEHKLKIMNVIEGKCRVSRRTDFTFYQAYYSPIDGKIERRKVNIEFV